MKKNTQALQPETYYHIYNRGNNKETIFKEGRNYTYFLGLYAKYIEPVADTYAYCLLGNHFHFLIRTKSLEEILNNLNVNEVQNLVDVSKKISNQFAKLFNSYTQAINKAYGRTGGLFETPFRRMPVEEDAYLSRLIAYIHQNPEKHGLVDDFRNYPYSSYQAHLLTKQTRLKRQEVLDWYRGREGYVSSHREEYKLTKEWLLE